MDLNGGGLHARHLATLAHDASADARRIVILGSQTLLNGLIARHLEDAIGIACRSHTPEELRPNRPGGVSLRGALVMLDGHRRQLAGICSDYGLPLGDGSAGGRICCFNVNHASGPSAEIEALRQGIHGVFYDNDSIEMVIKGVQAVLAGEFWFSRQVLGDFVMGRQHRGDAARRGPQAELTLREGQILKLIAAGLSNDEIATRLCISHHTVKTHAFNIYRKINVPNRIQASRWVTGHMG
jgi:DNA-binding CsgD family transcriptional regulator